MKKNLSYLLFAIGMLFLIGGCSDHVDGLVPADILDLGGRGEYVDAGVSNKLFKTVDQMSSNDVIVAINGYALTKSTFDRMMALRLKSYMKMGDNAQTAMSKIDEYRQRYPKLFIGHRVLIDRALAEGLVTPEEVHKSVVKSLRNSAKRVKKSVEDLLKPVKGFEDLYFYELAVNYVVSKVVDKEIPPLMEVNPAFVSNVQETVTLENAKARATNELFRAQLKALRNDILAKRISFEAASDKYSHVDGEDTEISEGGKWGKFAQGDFESAETERIVFSLRPGELSEVLEEPNGFHVVRVDKIIPATKYDDGSILTSEERELSHIWKSKIPFLLSQDDASLSRDLKRQMQMRAMNKFTTDLVTNGVNKVVYPNGRVLFVQ
jgi:peptidyl-prolyl cis-trans isomerase C/foldase protein PrsA